MSGGTLVVLDRTGRKNKQFNVPSGLVTLGSDPSCDVRILLPTVDSHHASIVVHTNKAVIHNVGFGDTLVNGVSVNVAPLYQDDLVTLGGRQLLWQYTHSAPHHTRTHSQTPVLQRVRTARSRRPVRRSAAPTARTPSAPTRNSTPGAVRTRQVAIVQPRRRDTATKTEGVLSPSLSVVTNSRRRRTSKSNTDIDTSINESGENRSKSKSPRTPQANSQNISKAKVWIESRKTSPRKSVKESPSRVEMTPTRVSARKKKSIPLRLTVLRKSQSAHKEGVVKIAAPSAIDYTKRTAIMLMAGHTPQKKISPKQSGVKTPRFVVQKRSPVKSQQKSGRKSKNVSSNRKISPIAKNTTSANKSLNESMVLQNSSVNEVQDTVHQPSTTDGDASASTSGRSPMLSNQKKSALKDSTSKQNSKKTDSIKFDLSNSQNLTFNPADVLTITNSKQRSHEPDSSEDKISLVYSDSSPGRSPSPRKPINSRSSKILEKALETTITINRGDDHKMVLHESPRSRKSLRGNMMVQKVLQSPNKTTVNSSEAISISNQSTSVPIASKIKSKIITSQSLDKNKMESYSIVDLVSNDSSQSIYNSVSDMSVIEFDTPLTSLGRRAASFKAESLLASSTPLKCNVKLRTTKSQSLPLHHSNENMYNEKQQERRIRNCKILNNTNVYNVNTTRSMRSGTGGSPPQTGMSTPENHNSPEEPGTPVLRIHNFLDGKANSTIPRQSRKGMTRKPVAFKFIRGWWLSPRMRTTISKSFSAGSRTLRRSNKQLDVSSDHGNTTGLNQDNVVTTPKSTLKLIQEGIKIRHSSAKRPKLKTSLIDSLNKSDIAKQLFNNPVKRNLSKSMIEFSREQLLDEDMTASKKPSRNTIALGSRASNDSLMEQTCAFPPEVFVSPLNTPSNSPSLVTLEDDHCDVEGVDKLMRTPRSRKQSNKQLEEVDGVKLVFPTLSRKSSNHMQTESLTATTPKNLNRATELGALNRSNKKNGSPKHDLGNLTGVRDLFMNKSPRNDLRNVSGVKATMRAHSPRNDLNNFEGVRNLFKRKRNLKLSNISGIEELDYDTQQSSLIEPNDLLTQRPAVKAYSKAKSSTPTSVSKPKLRQRHSMKPPFSSINNENVENESRKKHMGAGCRSNQSYEYDKNNSTSTSNSGRSKRNMESNTKNKSEQTQTILNNNQRISDQSKTSKTNTSSKKNRTINEVMHIKSLNKLKTRNHLPRELLILATDTVTGNSPVLANRIRNSSIKEPKKSISETYREHTLPIKKRPLVQPSKENGEKKNTLPIKKRVTMHHSTPVKGRYNATASAFNITGVGVVSPIAAINKSKDVNNLQNSGHNTRTMRKRQKLSKEALKPKPAQLGKTKSHKYVQTESQSAYISPKNNKTVTHIQTRRTINRKTELPNVLLNVSKKSLIITKKSPVRRQKLNKSDALVKIGPTMKVLRSKKITQVNLVNNDDDLSSSHQSSKQTKPIRSQRLRSQKQVIVPKAIHVTKLSPNSKPSSTKSSKNNILESSLKVKLQKKKVSKPVNSKLSVQNNENSVLTNQGIKGKKVVTQTDKVSGSSENVKSVSKSKRVSRKKEMDKKLITENNKTEQIEQERKNSRKGKKTIAQVTQDVIKATGPKTTKNTLVNKTQKGNANLKDKTGRLKPVTVTETTETKINGRKRKAEQKLSQESAAKLRKSDLREDVPRQSRRRKAELESVEKLKQNTRKKQIKKNEKLVSDGTMSENQSASDKEVGEKTNNKIVKTRAKNKTVVNEESAGKKEVTRRTRNTKPKPELKTKTVEAMQEVIPEDTATTSRRKKVVEPEKSQTRQRNRKTDNSADAINNKPELSKTGVVNNQAIRVTRARAHAIISEMEEQKPATRSRKR